MDDTLSQCGLLLTDDTLEFIELLVCYDIFLENRELIKNSKLSIHHRLIHFLQHLLKE